MNETVTRGPYRNGIRRREQIVASASATFAEFGYHAGSLRTIAERIGASPATLIQHFGSKEGLLTAVLDDWTERSTESISLRGARGLAYLHACRHLMDFHQENRNLLELFVTLTAEATSPAHPAHDFIQRRYAKTLLDWTTELRWGIEHGEFTPMGDARIESEIRLLIAVADGVEIQWLLDPTIPLAPLFNGYLDAAIARWQTRS